MNTTLYTSDIYQEITSDIADIIYEYGIIFEDEEEEYEESEFDYESVDEGLYHFPTKDTAYA